MILYYNSCKYHHGCVILLVEKYTKYEDDI